MQQPIHDTHTSNIAAALAVGQSTRVTCPCCGKERRAIVSRSEKGAWVHCFSDSCGLSAPVAMRELSSAEYSRVRAEREYAMQSRLIPRDWKSHLIPLKDCRELPSVVVWLATAGLSIERVENDIYWSLKYRCPCVVLQKGVSWKRESIFDADVEPVALVYRNLVDRPKWWMQTGERDACFITVPREVHNIQKPVVLCEDILSAIRIGRFYPCIAMLGTKVTPPVQLALMRGRIRTAIIWLDGDSAGRKATIHVDRDVKRSLNYVCLDEPDLTQLWPHPVPPLPKPVVLHVNILGRDPKHLTDKRIVSAVEAAVLCDPTR